MQKLRSCFIMASKNRKRKRMAKNVHKYAKTPMCCFPCHWSDGFCTALPLGKQNKPRTVVSDNVQQAGVTNTFISSQTTWTVCHLCPHPAALSQIACIYGDFFRIQRRYMVPGRVSGYYRQQQLPCLHTEPALASVWPCTNPALSFEYTCEPL